MVSTIFHPDWACQFLQERFNSEEGRKTMVGMGWKIMAVGVLGFFGLTVSSRAQEIDSKKFSEYFLAGFEKEAAGDYQAAFEAYTRALEINDASPAVLIRRAFCGAKIGMSRDMARDLKRATEVNPKTRTDFMTLAWFYGTNPFPQFRDGPRAINLGQKLQRESPSVETYDILAAGYATMGNFQMARNLIMEGLKRFPDTARTEEMEKRLALYNSRKPFVEEWVTGEKKK